MSLIFLCAAIEQISSEKPIKWKRVDGRHGQIGRPTVPGTGCNEANSMETHWNRAYTAGTMIYSNRSNRKVTWTSTHSVMSIYVRHWELVHGTVFRVFPIPTHRFNSGVSFLFDDGGSTSSHGGEDVHFHRDRPSEKRKVLQRGREPQSRKRDPSIMKSGPIPLDPYFFPNRKKGVFKNEEKNWFWLVIQSGDRGPLISGGESAHAGRAIDGKSVDC